MGLQSMLLAPLLEIKFQSPLILDPAEAALKFQGDGAQVYLAARNRLGWRYQIIPKLDTWGEFFHQPQTLTPWDFSMS